MARELRVEIIGDASSLQRALGKATGSSNRFGTSLKTLGKIAAVGVGAAFAGLAVAVKNGFDEISEGQQVMAQTQAGLKSTGQAANVTAKEIVGLAEAQSKLTGIDDEAIQAAENMLLTFTSVRNEVGKNNDIFNQATIAIGDMATRMNNGAIPSAEQLSTTAIRVGKALNDPVKGMTALSRVGVQFTKDQTEAIKAMVKAGDTMGAQKLILAELTKEFGGSAKAAGETLPGQLAKLRNSFDEVTAELAVGLMPLLLQFLNWINTHMPTIQAGAKAAASAIAAGFHAIGVAIDFLEGPLESFRGWLQDNPEKAKLLAGALIGLAAALTTATIAQAALNAAVLLNPYVAAIAGIGLLVGALAALYITNQRVHDAINENLVKLRTITQQTLAVVTAIWERFGESIKAIGEAIFLTVTLGFRNMLDAIRGFINIFAGLFTGDWRRMWTGVKQVFDAAIGNLLGVIRASVGAFLTSAKQIGLALLEGIVAGTSQLGPKVMQALLAVRAACISAAAQAVGWATGIGQAIVNGILSGVGGLFGALKDRLEGTLRSVLTSLNPFSPVEEGGAKYIGRPLAEGAIRGWLEGTRDLPAKMSESLRAAVEAGAQAVADARGVFAAAFSELSSAALAAFDKVAGEIETKTEKKIRLQDEARAAAERRRRLSEAEGARDKALAAGDIEGAVAAEREIAEALFAIRRADDEAQAAAERKKLDDRTAKRRRHFEEDLQALQNYANKQALSAEQLNQRLINIFERYNVPFKKAAIQLGSALAEGLHEAAAAVGNAAQKVRNEIMRHLSNIQIRVNVDVVVPDKTDRDKPPGRQHGGPVRAGQPYIVGEAGPELFVPRASGNILTAGSGGGGAGGITIFVAGSVVTERDLLDTIREGVLRIDRFNPGSAIARP